MAGSIPSRKVELEGRFICRCREFIRLGDAAEEVWEGRVFISVRADPERPDAAACPAIA